MPEGFRGSVARGTSWADDATSGRTLPLSAFYVAKPSDSAKAINAQLARGKNLLLTPGIYDIDRSIDVMIGKLRRKLDDGSGRQLIQTVRGEGYVLAVAVTGRT